MDLNLIKDKRKEDIKIALDFLKNNLDFFVIAENSRSYSDAIWVIIETPINLKAEKRQIFVEKCLILFQKIFKYLKINKNIYMLVDKFNFPQLENKIISALLLLSPQGKFIFFSNQLIHANKPGNSDSNNDFIQLKFGKVPFYIFESINKAFSTSEGKKIFQKLISDELID